MEIKKVAMGVSLLTAVFMLFAKMTAFFLTGSSAILSDAAESIIHIFASGIAAFSLWYSMQSPDKHHPYGHGKIVYFSAGFEGALIGMAALSIFYLAGRALLFGAELAELHLGILITASVAAVNGVLGWFLIRVGEQRHSLVLVAHGKHVLTDMWTSLGVVLGVGVVWVTQLAWLDPVVAILVAANICLTAVRLVRNAFHGLLDQADPEHTAQLLQCLHGCVERGQVNGFHQLRHRQTEGVIWVEMHVLMPEEMSTGDAHVRITLVEKAIRSLFPDKDVHITSHVEPVGNHNAHLEGHFELPDPFIHQGKQKTNT